MMANPIDINVLHETAKQVTEAVETLSALTKKKYFAEGEASFSEEEWAFFENYIVDQERLINAISRTLALTLAALAKSDHPFERFYYRLLDKIGTFFKNIKNALESQKQLIPLRFPKDPTVPMSMETSVLAGTLLHSFATEIREFQALQSVCREYVGALPIPRKKRQVKGYSTVAGIILSIAAFAAGCSAAEKAKVPPSTAHEITVKVIHERLPDAPLITEFSFTSVSSAATHRSPPALAARASSSSRSDPPSKPEPPKVDEERVRALVLEEIDDLVKQAKRVWESDGTDMIQEHSKLIQKIRDLQKKAR